MCSRKAFNSRELFAKIGMNSSELACRTGKKKKKKRVNHPAQPQTDRCFFSNIWRACSYNLWCNRYHTTLDANYCSNQFCVIALGSFLCSTSTPGCGLSLRLKCQACAARHAGVLICCKVTTPEQQLSVQANHTFFPSSSPRPSLSPDGW